VCPLAPNDQALADDLQKKDPSMGSTNCNPHLKQH
jgi:hypothetical protein